MEQDLEELETQRLESEKERSVLEAQYDESSIKQELLQQQKIRLQQEKFIVQVLSTKPNKEHQRKMPIKSQLINNYYLLLLEN